MERLIEVDFRGMAVVLVKVYLERLTETWLWRGELELCSDTVATTL